MPNTKVKLFLRYDLSDSSYVKKNEYVKAASAPSLSHAVAKSPLLFYHSPNISNTLLND